MAKIVQLEPDVFVGHQLVECDFAELAARGFRSVVNNRPDGEAPGQLPNRQAHALALRHGLAFRYLPVISANITDDDVVDEFANLINDLPRPILFYCRSGTRCATLWTQVMAQRLDIASALETAAKAGYDLEILRDDLIEQAGARAEQSTRPAVGAA
jgi:sulfide:quinone oxidoreductase